jgi:hypothetical protein
LIERAKSRQLSGYYETHHIKPRCLGGTDDVENLCKLRADEHFLAHLLLMKIHSSEPKLVFAVMKMHLRVSERPSRKMYAWVRERYAEAVRQRQIGSGNNQFGTVWITDGINAKKINKDVDLPPGWSYGRTSKKKCDNCGEPASSQQSKYCRAHKLEALKANGKNAGIKNVRNILGRAKESYAGKKFITNGMIDKLHDPSTPTPDGWRYGRSVNRPKN